MKKFILQHTNALLFFSAFSACLFSCNKKDLLVDANYPDQKIYMSQAAVATVGPGANGIYSITANREGVVQRFTADVAGGKFNVPLGVVKSGVSLSGAYTINIAANTDSVGKLITAGKFLVTSDPTLTTELLPSSAYTLPSSVNIADGDVSASFTLGINLSFLTNSVTVTPKKRYAIAVSISNSKSSLIQTSLATTVIFIDPVQVILPVANFSSFIEVRTANFLNSSLNGASYSWNFGDATPISSSVAPSHVYSAPGTYAVTLTTTGIAGSGAASVKTANIVIL